MNAPIARPKSFSVKVFFARKSSTSLSVSPADAFFGRYSSTIAISDLSLRDLVGLADLFVLLDALAELLGVGLDDLLGRGLVGHEVDVLHVD